MMVVREESVRGLLILHIEGPLRVPVCTAFRQRIQALLRADVRQILINLAGVPAIDAGGVGELVHVYNMTSAAQGALRIAEAGVRVAELIDRAGLIGILTADSERWWLEAVRDPSSSAPIRSLRV
jgi:anti-anti-sigma factor